MNIFSYQVIQVFCKTPMLLSLIRPILGHPLSMKITGFIPLRQKHLWDLMLKMATELLSYIVTVQLFFSWTWTACFRTTLDLFGLLLHLFYFIIRDSICTFLASEIELFMAVVNDVNLVTIAMDSSFLGSKFTTYNYYFY